MKFSVKFNIKSNKKKKKLCVNHKSGFATNQIKKEENFICFKNYDYY